MTTILPDVASPEIWSLNSSSAPTVRRAFYGAYFEYGDNFHLDSERFAGNFVTHSKMISRTAGGAEDATLLYYLCTAHSFSPKPANSASSAKSLSAEYYRKIENRLLSLCNDEEDEDELVERGAVESALSLVKDLQTSDLAPPAISWHGGDAVVMLWALGSTTYAITVTDGELGYVVRQNRKEIKAADSIKLGAFRLEDLR